MKKLLSLLATTGLVATTSATAVSCKIENLGTKSVTLNKEEIEVEQGKTGEVRITSSNDLAGVKITDQIENKVTAIIEDKKITITVSKTAKVKDYILTITGNKINDKNFTVKVKESNN